MRMSPIISGILIVYLQLVLLFGQIKQVWSCWKKSVTRGRL